MGPEGQRLPDLIDADVPGECGRALVNAAREGVGMITPSERTAFGGTRSSFAIPVERALALVEDIRAGRGSAGS